MPQMAPLSWLSLYMIFSITLILFCIMNYYIFIPSPLTKTSSKKSSSNNFHWKW
uniref:ATP synthase complex subunit 8 n=1 Tax=Sympycnus pulicarius TaxID=2307310 RepID=A0A7D7A5H4_9MUSC|nr:ATP synthase F0 subunit 8 [Sympycnus pulicarius]